jgi:aminoglycoside phosphotransferase (APT) family kinase protein
MMYRLPQHMLGGISDVDLAANGIPSEEEYVAAYCHRTGREGIPALDFYITFNMFRFAAIIHGIKGRLARGNATSPNAASFVAILPELANLACKQVGLRS